MPWFPEFYSAVELARRNTHVDGLVDPVGQYFSALENGDTRTLETAWPGHVVVFDPRAGEVRGHRQLRRFVQQNQRWLAERKARPETLATTSFGQRAVVELLVELNSDSGHRGKESQGGETTWPVAVVAESGDRLSVAFRTYCSQWPVDGRRHVRAPILTGADVALGGVIGRFHQAVEAGDADAAVRTFTPNGYIRESTGAQPTHRGTVEMFSFFTRAFSAGGGIALQGCAVTDDGERCALEYNCARWGSHELSPQAGLAVLERGRDGLLAAVRMYDDVQPPIEIR